MKILPLLIILVLLFGMLYFARRTRQRSADAEQQRRGSIGLGTEVMTTSGLYGTVVDIDEAQDTVLLRIAPGIEVKWAFAALREANSLPDRYRKGLPDAAGTPGPASDDGSPGTGNPDSPSGRGTPSDPRSSE